MNPEEYPREDLSLEANASRTRLLRAIEELDRRGHDALDVRLQLRRHGREIALAVAALAMAASGMAFLAVEALLAFGRWRRGRRRRW
jgi:hypothetical protein